MGCHYVSKVYNLWLFLLNHREIKTHTHIYIYAYRSDYLLIPQLHFVRKRTLQT